MEAAELERVDEMLSHRRWADAYELLSQADERTSLGAAQLELLGRTAYLLGRDDDYVDGLERAHRLHEVADDLPSAARCAFWIGHNLVFRGRMSPARGWFARAQRLLDRADTDCVERGYLLVPRLLERLFAGDAEGVCTVAADILEIGERFADRDLVALATMEQGHALVRRGQVTEGLRLVDETMVAVTLGELSPVVAGIVYCNTITFCRSTFEVRRAREWTAALTRWCDDQPQMVTHHGQCRVHRAEILAIEGHWSEALDDLRGLEDPYVGSALDRLALGDAAYQRGEVHRRRGEFPEAESAYRDASRRGRPPEPGLALLRLAQGRVADAAAAIRRAVVERTGWADRAAVLPAYVEIMLAVGDPDAARSAGRELERIAARQDTDVLRAGTAQANGAISLALDAPGAALIDLRRAWRIWHELGAPHHAARARVAIASCCRALGDEDTATLELDAARAAFEELGARPDLARLAPPSSAPSTHDLHGLTDREHEVLRLVAAGRSNKQVATELVISEHTVARHLQNVFLKLDVSSRTAASAIAHEHGWAGHGRD